MPVFNTTERWGWIAKLFHWTIALMIIGMLGFGMYIAEFLGPYEKPGPTSQHKAVGLVILALVVGRIVWRLMNRKTPALPVHTRPIERLMAHGAHLALYALMILMPLSGWLSASAAPLSMTVTVLGVEIPHLISPQAATDFLRGIGMITATNDMEAMSQSWATFKAAHAAIAKVLLLVIVAHIAAALKHHFIDRDTVLSRMLPFGK